MEEICSIEVGGDMKLLTVVLRRGDFTAVTQYYFHENDLNKNFKSICIRGFTDSGNVRTVTWLTL
jgi:hypothetical protein